MEATKFATIGLSGTPLKTRPEQHITDSEASAIFEAAFSDWAVNPSKRDYGWDYNVGVFRNNVTTGVHFYGQLKGSRHTDYSSDRSFVSQSLEYVDADYLARLLTQPTFLFHADVVLKKLFWSSIQLDQKVLTALETGEVKSLTVRIPTANVLPDCMSAFLSDIKRSHIVVTKRILTRITAFDFVDAMAGQPLDQLEDEAADLHQKAFILEMQRAQLQLKSGDVGGAITAVQKVVSNSTSSIEVHFNSTFQLGGFEALQMMKSTGPHALVADKKLATALELCRIANRSPKYLHLFAQITRKAAELEVAVEKSVGLLMSRLAHERSGHDTLWLNALGVQLQKSLVVTHRKYSQSLRFAKAIIKSRFRWITPRPITDVGGKHWGSEPIVRQLWF